MRCVLAGVGGDGCCVLMLSGRVASYGMACIILLLASHRGFGNFGGSCRVQSTWCISFRKIPGLYPYVCLVCGWSDGGCKGKCLVFSQIGLWRCFYHRWIISDKCSICLFISIWITMSVHGSCSWLLGRRPRMRINPPQGQVLSVWERHQ